MPQHTEEVSGNQETLLGLMISPKETQITNRLSMFIQTRFLIWQKLT